MILINLMNYTRGFFFVCKIISQIYKEVVHNVGCSNGIVIEVKVYLIKQQI